METLIRALREKLTAEDRRKFILLALPVIAFCLLLAVWCIPEEEAASVVKLPKETARQNIEAKNTGNIPVTRRSVTLHSPFDAMHTDRDSSVTHIGQNDPASAKQGASSAKPVRREPVRLIGTAVSQKGTRRAILARGKEQWSMAPGDSHGDITLLELTEEQAIIESSDGEAVLRLPGR